MWLLVLAMALPLSTQTSSERHVRATEPRILALIDAGLSRSPAFRRLVAGLNESDVIVHIEPKRTRQALGGYLAHHIVARGDHRYLRIAVETQGSQGRLVPLLAHELQHAVEIAQAPEVRDAATLEQLFVRLAVRFGCDGTTCYETQAARDVEHIVRDELKAHPADRGGSRMPIGRALSFAFPIVSSPCAWFRFEEAGAIATRRR